MIIVAVTITLVLRQKYNRHNVTILCNVDNARRVRYTVGKDNVLPEYKTDKARVLSLPFTDDHALLIHMDVPIVRHLDNIRVYV